MAVRRHALTTCVVATATATKAEPGRLVSVVNDKGSTLRPLTAQLDKTNKITKLKSLRVTVTQPTTYHHSARARRARYCYGTAGNNSNSNRVIVYCLS
jgi:hypothetical protein